MSAKSPFSPVVRCKNIIMNIAIFASGSGTNCENLIHHFADSALVKVALVVSNKPDAFVLERAQRLGVPTAVTPKTDLHNPDIMLPLLRKYDIGFIVLAGWLPWGHHVHEAVKAAGETETGMTVHWVTPVCDAGEIIAQFRVALSPDDTVETIAEKEHMLEMEHFPKVVEDIIKKSAADN